ncbi:MAG: EAL domain-containing protein [Magnetococcales bacterium]|nr:EAL domain-containing protein [Magnetococcales bacterium]MBF0151110.1 EAL domain-containing protein [Magnetococcales bacterium]MBF0346773.1 EAL domain-containing protein [Magnetococcales bacterium]
MISNAVWGWWIQVNQQLDMFELVDDMYAEDRLFAEDRLSTAVVAAPSIWKILVIDDEPDIHQLTRMVLRGLRFDGLGIEVISGFNGREACAIMEQTPDVAVLLLDVVMETDQAGLEVVRHIREELKNGFVRIILRTGQAGQAPEPEVIAQYDINDYREKTELTSQKLITAVTSALRAYRDLRLIENLAMNLKRERESLKRAQAMAHLGNWEWELDSGHVTFSDEMLAIIGLSRVAAPTGIAVFLDRIHSEDRIRVEQVLSNMAAIGERSDLECRIVRPDGSIRTVHLVCESNHGDHAELSRMLCTVHDITNTREVEDRLKIATTVFGGAMEEVHEHMRIATKVLENAIEGVMVTDDKGVIRSVNPAFTRITGYDPVEMIGNPMKILHNRHLDVAFHEQLWKSLMDVGIWRGEVWNRKKNGEAYPQWETIIVIRDREGKVTNFISIFHDLTEIRASQKELHFKTYHDTLTGLPNRDLFADRLNQAVVNAQRNNGKVLVIFLGLDHFKKINNSLGHQLGDQLLKDVAARLRTFIREGDTLSRLAGDSFGFIMREIRNTKDAVFVARKINNALTEPFTIEEHKLFLTASTGITLFPEDGQDASTLIKNADMALNRAKVTGRDTCTFYKATMGEQANRRLKMEKNMRQGLERDEFVLFYQPKVSLKTGQVVGMEALVRWLQPDAGMVSPGEFIPVAEETGLILPLGEWILKSACRQNRIWGDAGFGNLRMAVNLSVRQFRQHDLFDRIRMILEETGLQPSLLELEITESMMMDNVEAVITTMTRLRSLGLFIAVDDFGTGYSSLSYLKRFPIHTLKIDQSFVRDLTLDSDDAAIINAIIAMAKSLKLDVVAEGVETEEQLNFLRAERCDEMQGYYFSKPLSAHEFTELLKSGRQLKNS